MKKVRSDVENAVPIEGAPQEQGSEPLKRTRKISARASGIRALRDVVQSEETEELSDVSVSSCDSQQTPSIPLDFASIDTYSDVKFIPRKRYYLIDEYEQFGDNESEDNFDEEFDDDFMQLPEDEFNDWQDFEEEEDFGDELDDETASLIDDEFDVLNTDENFYEGDEDDEEGSDRER